MVERCTRQAPLLVWFALSGALAAQPPLFLRAGDAPSDRLGRCVRALGDVDGDGRPDFAVGAPYAAYVRVYSGQDGAPIRTLRGRNPSENFGWNVAGGADVDADGHDDVLVSIPYRQNASVPGATGAVEIWSGKTGVLLRTLSAAVDQSVFGLDVAGLGDVDQDGHGDYAIAVPALPGNPQVRIHSGKTNALLRTLFAGNWAGSPTLRGTVLRATPDCDGDGVRDLLIGCPYTGSNQVAPHVDLYSGRTGVLLAHAAATRTQGTVFGEAICMVGDFDGDGRPDIGVGDPSEPNPATGLNGAAFVFSSKTGARLRTVHTPPGYPLNSSFGSAVAALGDYDRDGVPDLAVGLPRLDVQARFPGRVLLCSGADGRVLGRFDGPSGTPDDNASLGAALESVADFDGDGIADLAVTAPIDNVQMASNGSVRVYAGAPRASATFTGLGCGGQVLPPILRTALPRLGQSVTCGGAFTMPLCGGGILVSDPPAQPLPIGAGCTVYVHPTAMLLLATVTTDAAGAWTKDVPLPLERAFLGHRLVLQAAFVPTNGPGGFDLTDAAAWTLGF